MLRLLLADPVVSAAAVDGGSGVITGKALKERAAAKLAQFNVMEVDEDGEEKPAADADAQTGGGGYDDDDAMEEDEQREVLSFEIDPAQVRAFR